MLEWSEVEKAAGTIHWGAFLATADKAGRPHLAFVSPGLVNGLVWVVSDLDTQKVRNVRDNPHVALHWPVDADDTNLQLFVRGQARVRTDPGDKEDLWSRNPVPWSLAGFYSGPADPELVFIEITPTYASLAPAFGEGHRVWRA